MIIKTALIIHSTPDREEYFDPATDSESNKHWIAWLQKQLLINGIFTQTPEMPDAYNPDYKKWKREFERFDVNEQSALIGHSCGGGFLVRWLSENRVKGNKLVLVAPWLDPTRRKTTGFFEFKIDGEISSRFKNIHLFVSKDDNKEILTSVDTILKAVPNIKVHSFKNMGHFCFENMKTNKFPELLNVMLT